MLEVETEQSNEVQNPFAQGRRDRGMPRYVAHVISVPLNLGAFPLETKRRCSWVEKYGMGPVEIAQQLSRMSILFHIHHIHIKPLPELWELWPRIFIFSAPTRVDHPQHELHLVTALVSGG